MKACRGRADRVGADNAARGMPSGECQAGKVMPNASHACGSLLPNDVAGVLRYLMPQFSYRPAMTCSMAPFRGFHVAYAGQGGDFCQHLRHGTAVASKAYSWTCSSEDTQAADSERGRFGRIRGQHHMPQAARPFTQCVKAAVEGDAAIGQQHNALRPSPPDHPCHGWLPRWWCPLPG